MIAKPISLAEIGTRFLVLLLPNGHPNPLLEVAGETLVMVTLFATAIRTAEPGRQVASPDHDHLRVIRAIDVPTGRG